MKNKIEYEDIVTKIQSYESKEKFRLSYQLRNIPKQYLGLVGSATQYKFIHDHLTNIIFDIAEDITPNLSKPMQDLADSLIFFIEAVFDNLGTYYALFISIKQLMLRLLATPTNGQFIRKEMLDILKGIIQALAESADLRLASQKLVNAKNVLNNTIITISGQYNNAQQLEKDVRDAYSRVEEHNMTIYDYQAYLDILKAELGQEQTQDLVAKIESEIIGLENRISEVEYQANKAFNLAQNLEDDLNNARLEPLGYNTISSSWKVAFPLFQRLTESISKVSANYETMKSIISNAGNIGIIELIGFTDEILKMAILGDYVTNNSFYLCCDPVMVELEKARGQKIHEALDIVRRAPAIEAGKVCALKSIVDSTNGKNKENEELVFAVSEPVVLSVEDL